MPTYEYACTSCGDRFDVHQSFKDDPLINCSKCGGTLRRVFHPVGVMFKGSGFYSTDSKSKKAGDAKVDKPKTDSNTKTSDTKSEAKPSETKNTSNASSSGEK